jgi:hypothetical protein
MKVLATSFLLVLLIISPSLASNNCDNPPNRGDCTGRGR